MNNRDFVLTLIVICAALAGCNDNKQLSPEEDIEQEIEVTAPCTDGVADDTYPCQNIDLVAHLSPESLMGDTLNDIWGWVDPQTGTEYALVGLTDGVSFVDLSDPAKPVTVGKLRETEAASKAVKAPHRSGVHLRHEGEGKSDWRDFKVYNNYLFVVSDYQPDNIQHGMQVFDLTRLRGAGESPQEFTADVVYSEFKDAHNIAINEETGFAYVVGSDTYGGGLHIVDISNPLSPEFAGFHADTTVGLQSTGYVHDTQCVIYQGPDADYQGDEVCFNSSETHLVLANVTRKDSTYSIASKSYEGNAYAHQGWLTEDHRYFLLDDEVDEMRHHVNTRTYIWDVQDLDNPEMIGVYESSNSSSDHNQYIKGDYTYQANYTSGLRILDLSDIASGSLEEVAYFDTYPKDDRPAFRGAWSNYPFLPSGVVVVSDITRGLFILKPTM